MLAKSRVERVERVPDYQESRGLKRILMPQCVFAVSHYWGSGGDLSASHRRMRIKYKLI